MTNKQQQATYFIFVFSCKASSASDVDCFEENESKSIRTITGWASATASRLWERLGCIVQTLYVLPANGYGVTTILCPSNRSLMTALGVSVLFDVHITARAFALETAENVYSMPCCFHVTLLKALCGCDCTDWALSQGFFSFRLFGLGLMMLPWLTFL
jgi:hypothetical protein